MPAPAPGHKTYMPKARERMTDTRGGHAKGRLSSEKQQLKSPTPIPRREQRPQEKFPNIKQSVQEAFELVKEIATPEHMWTLLPYMRVMVESVHGGSERRNSPSQSPQVARVPVPADARRIRAHPSDKEEYTRSPRAGRGHGSRAARGDECASGPKTHASHGRGGPRRDGELQAPQPKGSAKKRDPIIKPAPARAVRMSPSQNPERRKGRQPEEEDKELRSPSTINDSSLSDSDSSSKAESPRPSSRSRSRSSSGSLKASGRSARREPARPPLQNQAPKGPASQSPVVLTSAETKTPAVGKKKEGSFSPAVAGHSKNPPPPPPPPKRAQAGPAQIEGKEDPPPRVQPPPSPPQRTTSKRTTTCSDRHYEDVHWKGDWGGDWCQRAPRERKRASSDFCPEGRSTHENEGAQRKLNGNTQGGTGQLNVVYAKVDNEKCFPGEVTSDLRNLGASILIIDLGDPKQATDFTADLEQVKSEAATAAERAKYKVGSRGHGRGEERSPKLQWQYEVISHGRFILAGRKGFVTSIRKMISMRTKDTQHDIVVFEANLKVALCNAQSLKLAVAGDVCSAAPEEENTHFGYTWLQAMNQLWKNSVRILAGQFTTNVGELFHKTRQAGYEFHAIAVDPVCLGQSQGAVGPIVTSSFMFGLGPINSIAIQTESRNVKWGNPEAGEWLDCSTITGWPGLHKLARSEPNDHSSYEFTKGWPVYAVSLQKATTNRKIAHPPPQLR